MEKCLNATLLDNPFIPESTVSFNNKNEEKLETEELELDMDAIGEQNQETSELMEAEHNEAHRFYIQLIFFNPKIINQFMF